MNASTLTKALGQVAHDKGYRVSVDQAHIDVMDAKINGIITGGLRGITEHDKRRMTLKPMDEWSLMQVTAHELAHVILHDPFGHTPSYSALGGIPSFAVPESIKELQAELTAHRVLGHYDLVGDHTFSRDYCIGWLNGIPEQYQESAWDHAVEVSEHAANEIILAVEAVAA